jgi:hypothetical protein
MERNLRSDFSDVVVHVSALSCALNKCFGAQAFTIRNHICFSEGTFDPESDCGQKLLAHELAHVVQKRLGKDGIGQKRVPSASELEIEAEAAALLLQQDEGSFPVTADPTDLPRFWGPEGHYYTVYLMALTAGVSDSTASALAFYAQMPDQVRDLDAVVAGKAWAETVAVRTILPVTGRLITRPQEPHIDVQKGLHCLTGNNAKAETAFRSRILEGLDIKSVFEYGLALHAFGDSFAHRDSDTDSASMYLTPYGHLFQGKSLFDYATMGLKKPEDVVKMGAEVDDINERQGLYVQYGTEMYGKFVQKMGKGGRPPVEIDEVRKTLQNVCSNSASSAQTAALQAQIRKRGGGSTYTPENEPVNWDEFERRHADMVNRFMQDRARRLIWRWSLGQGD